MINSKLPNTGVTIFTKMSGMAKKYEALNLSQGFPDFEGSSELHALVGRYIQEGNNQYAPMQGALTLRQAIADKTKKLYGVDYNVENEITVTAGATQAIFTAITACISKDDEVIVFGPAYDCYEPAIQLCGGITKFINLEAPDYKLPLDKLVGQISHRTKMLIINSPHNPTGAVLTHEDMLQLQTILKDTNIIVISDEVYEHIIFDGANHRSIVSYPELAKRAFVISSFGKTYHITGWKIGYCIAPRTLRKEFQKVHQFNVFSCNHPVQLALAEFMQKEDEYTGLLAMYQKKRDVFIKGLHGSKFKFVPTTGTYFQLLDYSQIDSIPDIEMAEKLVKDYGIAAIPISVFYKNPPEEDRMLRFCFAKGEETLLRACEILKSI